MRTKAVSYEKPLIESAVTVIKEAEPSFIAHVLAAHTVTSAAGDIPGTVVNSNSVDTYHKPQPPLKTVLKSLPDKRSKIKLVLADLGVVTKSNVEEIVESPLTKNGPELYSRRSWGMSRLLSTTHYRWVVLTQLMALKPPWGTYLTKCGRTGPFWLCS